MFKNPLKTAYLLTAIIALLAVLASAGGLFMDGIYLDNRLVASGWRGNDLVTLLVAVPLLLGAMFFARRGSLRAQLVWLGLLDYLLYNYAFYLFGAAFNTFFLVYAALFTLSIFALILGLVALNVKALGWRFSKGTPVKAIAGYMLCIALGLSAAYLAQWVVFISSGQLPPVVTLTEHPTSVVFALDFSLVIPIFLLAAIWLWQERAWGYVLAAIANVKGVVYMMALSAATVAAVQSGASDDLAQLALWGFIGVGCLMATLFLFKLNPKAA
ncbi:hypothetical protein ACX8XP_05255 [Calditrichota bacterium LG25]